MPIQKTVICDELCEETVILPSQFQDVIRLSSIDLQKECNSNYTVYQPVPVAQSVASLPLDCSDRGLRPVRGVNFSEET